MSVGHIHQIMLSDIQNRDEARRLLRELTWTYPELVFNDSLSRLLGSLGKTL